MLIYWFSPYFDYFCGPPVVLVSYLFDSVLVFWINVLIFLLLFFYLFIYRFQFFMLKAMLFHTFQNFFYLIMFAMYSYVSFCSYWTEAFILPFQVVTRTSKLFADYSRDFMMRVLLYDKQLPTFWLRLRVCLSKTIMRALGKGNL